MFRDVVATRRRVQGPDHPRTLMAMGNLALTLNNEKRYEDVEKLYRETLAIKRQKLGRCIARRW